MFLTNQHENINLKPTFFLSFLLHFLETASLRSVFKTEDSCCLFLLFHDNSQIMELGFATKKPFWINIFLT